MKMIAQRTCGHVICAPCVKQFSLVAGKKCPMCGAKCKARDFVELFNDGTGFADGGGKTVAKSYTHAFQ